MVIGKNGETPNIGSNDGALFEILHSCDYRDFRPSTQLIFGILDGIRVFEEGPWDEPLFWYLPKVYKTGNVTRPSVPKQELIDNQFLILRRGKAVMFMVLPNNRFRPNSCDAFHIDLWVDGINWLSDQGSYSYNAGKFTDNFKSVKSHNTIQYGNIEQMPKISRFLYANWLNTDFMESKNTANDSLVWKGSYTVQGYYKHTRKVVFHDYSLEVLDEIDANSNEIIHLRWHSPLNLNAHIFAFDGNNHSINACNASNQCSHYYLEMHEVNVYEFSTTSKKVRTYITWS
jgi:hypothetical protein